MRFGTSGSGIRAAVLAATFLTAAQLTAPLALAEKPFDFMATPGKLPKTVIPTAYRLDLVPNLDKLTFTSAEEIDIAVAKATDTITLNQNDLAIDSVTLKGEDGAKASVSLDGKAQTATFKFPHPLGPGKHTLSVSYSGPITAQPAGLYYYAYDVNGAR